MTAEALPTGRGDLRAAGPAPPPPRNEPLRSRRYVTSRSGVLRIFFHGITEAPILVFGIIEMAKGWRPLFDNAQTAYRAYHVFGTNSPLVGHLVYGSFRAYAPGPLEYWLLAIPVRLDAGHGALWGGIVVAIGAIALAIEAGWATAGEVGGFLATALILMLLIMQPTVSVDVVYSAWLAAIGLFPTIFASWATAMGKIRWWPVAILGASLVAQCEEVFLLPALAAPAVAILIGWWFLSRDKLQIPIRPVIVGLGVALLAWSAPLLQQVTNSPGNLSLLWRAAHQHFQSVGYKAALQQFSTLTRPYPQWAHVAPVTGSLAGIYYAFEFFVGSLWWGVAALVLLGVITAGAWARNNRKLASLSGIAFCMSVAEISAVAGFPKAQLLTFRYLSALAMPIGALVWCVFAWTLVIILNRAYREMRRGRETTLSQLRSYKIVVPATVILLGLSWLSVWGAQSTLEGSGPTLGSWSAVRLVRSSADEIERIHPKGPFNVSVGGDLRQEHFAILTGVVYLLASDGLQPRVTGALAEGFGAGSQGSTSLAKVKVQVTGGTSDSLQTRIERQK